MTQCPPSSIATVRVWEGYFSSLQHPQVLRRMAPSPKSASPPRVELELELVQSHMAQMPVLLGEVRARALRVRSVSREEAWAEFAAPSIAAP